MIASSVLLVVALAVSGSAHAAVVLDRAKAAQGGAAWESVRSLHLAGTLASGGLEGSLEALVDVRGGRFRDTFQLGPTKGANGFDGQDAWSQDAAGEIRKETSDAARRTALNASYRWSQGWWFTARRPAAIRELDERSERGKHFYVLSITPAGGRPFELWVDAATFLFDRSVERIEGAVVVTSMSDWRDVGGLKVPFSMRIAWQGDDGRQDQRIVWGRVERDVPISHSALALPAPPSAAPGQRASPRRLPCRSRRSRRARA